MGGFVLSQQGSGGFHAQTFPRGRREPGGHVARRLTLGRPLDLISQA